MPEDAQPQDAAVQGVPFVVAVVPGAGAGRWERMRYWLYKYVGTLLMVRANHGDVVVSLERVSYAAVLLLALHTWWSGHDIPPSMGGFLNVLVGAVLGQGALSTAGFYIRTKATGR